MLSILIPVYNEEALLEQSVQRIHRHLEASGIAHEVLVTSNGSTDRTAAIGGQLAASHSWFRFFDLRERSVGKAFVNGVQNARGEYIVCVDIDLSIELNFLDYAADLLKFADMVAGSKTMGRQRRGLIRVLGSQLYILFTLALFDLTLSDYSMGAKAFRRESILEALPHLDDWTGYVFELALFLKNRGRKIIQIGVDCEDTRKSRFNLIHEGFYRYRHLFLTHRRSRMPGSWLARPRV